MHHRSLQKRDRPNNIGGFKFSSHRFKSVIIKFIFQSDNLRPLHKYIGTLLSIMWMDCFGRYFLDNFDNYTTTTSPIQTEAHEGLWTNTFHYSIQNTFCYWFSPYWDLARLPEGLAYNFTNLKNILSKFSKLPTQIYPEISFGKNWTLIFFPKAYNLRN